MNLEMYRGDAAIWNLICYQNDGTRLDISSGSLFFAAKASTNMTDVQALFIKTIGDGITVTDGPNGLCTVELDKTDTEGISAPSSYQWGLQYVTTGNKPYTLMRGRLTVKADIAIGIS